MQYPVCYKGEKYHLVDTGTNLEQHQNTRDLKYPKKSSHLTKFSQLPRKAVYHSLHESRFLTTDDQLQPQISSKVPRVTGKTEFTT